MRRNRILRTFGVMILLFVMATAMYAFTASNTVPDSNAGFGSGDIAGYTVSDITYDIDGNEITAVYFTLTPDASGAFATSVSVAFRGDADADLGSFDCAVADADVDCTGLDVDLEAAVAMDVAAAQ